MTPGTRAACAWGNSTPSMMSASLGRSRIPEITAASQILHRIRENPDRAGCVVANGRQAPVVGSETDGVSSLVPARGGRDLVLGLAAPALGACDHLSHAGDGETYQVVADTGGMAEQEVFGCGRDRAVGQGRPTLTPEGSRARTGSIQTQIEYESRLSAETETSGDGAGADVQ